MLVPRRDITNNWTLCIVTTCGSVDIGGFLVLIVPHSLALLLAVSPLLVRVQELHVYKDDDIGALLLFPSTSPFPQAED